MKRQKTYKSSTDRVAKRAKINKKRIAKEAEKLVIEEMESRTGQIIHTAIIEALSLLAVTKTSTKSHITAAYYAIMAKVEKISMPPRSRISIHQLSKYKLMYNTPYGDNMCVSLSFNTDKSVFSLHAYWISPYVDYRYIEPPLHAQAHVVLDAMRIITEVAVARLLNERGIRDVSLIFAEEEIEELAWHIACELACK